ncbi:MAG TPA: hypothetical protein VIO11_01580, partial [Candidatus Methanoperedens sp.]
QMVIRSNITNSGTKADTLPVDLIFNGTIVKNTSLSLGRGQTKEINFTGNLKGWVTGDVKPGNYTVEILGKTQLLRVREEPLNLPLIAGIITILAASLIYVLTAKNLINLDALKEKLSGGLGKIRNKASDIYQKAA